MKKSKMFPHIIAFSDGRRLELYPSPFGDRYSIQVKVIGKRGSTQTRFVLDRSSINVMSEMIKP